MNPIVGHYRKCYLGVELFNYLSFADRLSWRDTGISISTILRLFQVGALRMLWLVFSFVVGRTRKASLI